MSYLLVVCSADDKPGVVEVATRLFGAFEHYMPTGYSLNGIPPVTHYACAFDADNIQTQEIFRVASEDLKNTRVYSLGPEDRAVLKLAELGLQKVS